MEFDRIVSKISPKRIQVRFSTGYVEVITEILEPHLNHVLCNSLIINEFDILHREVAGRLASINIHHKKTVRRSL